MNDREKETGRELENEIDFKKIEQEKPDSASEDADAAEQEEKAEEYND